MTNKKKENLQGLLFASPPLIAFALFGLLPLLVSLVLSFCLVEYNFEGGVELTFLGFKNYIEILTNDTRFLKSIGNTFTYAFITVFLQIVLALILSICLNTKIKFKKYLGKTRLYQIKNRYFYYKEFIESLNNGYNEPLSSFNEKDRICAYSCLIFIREIEKEKSDEIVSVYKRFADSGNSFAQIKSKRLMLFVSCKPLASE